MSDVFEELNLGDLDGMSLRVFIDSNDDLIIAMRKQDYPSSICLATSLNISQAALLANRLIDLATHLQKKEQSKKEPTDRFAMGTPSVDHAGENKDGDL